MLSLQLAEQNLGFIYAALGIHPWNIQFLSLNELEQTRLIFKQGRFREKVVAKGEVGLDFSHGKKQIADLLTETDGPVRFEGSSYGKMTTPSFIPQVINATAEIKEKERNRRGGSDSSKLHRFFRCKFNLSASIKKGQVNPHRYP